MSVPCFISSRLRDGINFSSDNYRDPLFTFFFIDYRGTKILRFKIDLKPQQFFINLGKGLHSLWVPSTLTTQAGKKEVADNYSRPCHRPL